MGCHCRVINGQVVTDTNGCQCRVINGQVVTDTNGCQCRVINSQAVTDTNELPLPRVINGQAVTDTNWLTLPRVINGQVMTDTNGLPLPCVINGQVVTDTNVPRCESKSPAAAHINTAKYYRACSSRSYQYSQILQGMQQPLILIQPNITGHAAAAHINADKY